jgi:murein DD-endopeptidase MepM/ murein hydrolase activator NlpD
MARRWGLALFGLVGCVDTTTITSPRALRTDPRSIVNSSAVAIDAPTLAPIASPTVAIAEPVAAPDLAPIFFPSPPLRAASLRSPIPGAVFAGYVGDTGLDLASPPRTVRAIADATVDYAEAGHTRWVGPRDTALCVRITLDSPIVWRGGHHITHVYYAHLSKLAFEQREGAAPKRHVRAGEPLGTSGIANGVPHLHLGLLLDGEVEQDDWTYILREGEVREALGGYRNGERLTPE